MASGIDHARVIQGEDDESEDDIEVKNFISLSDSQHELARAGHQGIVVCGEASESDDELADYDLKCSGQRSRHSSRESSSKLESFNFDQPKYHSLLHKKLRDRNILLRRNFVDIACQPYETASKEISSISQQLVKSQLLVQEVSSTLRRLTNELFLLEDKVDTIRCCNLLPDLFIGSFNPEEH